LSSSARASSGLSRRSASATRPARSRRRRARRAGAGPAPAARRGRSRRRRPRHARGRPRGPRAARLPAVAIVLMPARSPSAPPCPPTASSPSCRPAFLSSCFLSASVSIYGERGGRFTSISPRTATPARGPRSPGRMGRAGSSRVTPALSPRPANRSGHLLRPRSSGRRHGRISSLQVLTTPGDAGGIRAKRTRDAAGRLSRLIQRLDPPLAQPPLSSLARRPSNEPAHTLTRGPARVRTRACQRQDSDPGDRRARYASAFVELTITAPRTSAEYGRSTSALSNPTGQVPTGPLEVLSSPVLSARASITSRTSAAVSRGVIRRVELYLRPPAQRARHGGLPRL
jgi:hypothetical protein